LSADLSALPFLAPAVLRHLEQYPSLENGLNRTERQILAAAAAGLERPDQLFAANQRADGVRFMGDLTFWGYLKAMVDTEPALLRTRAGSALRRPDRSPWPDELEGQRLALTATGEAVLAGRADWLAIHPIDRWYGGVHLHPGNSWRWDGAQRRLCRE
jgi:hypothetical protein